MNWYLRFLLLQGSKEDEVNIPNPAGGFARPTHDDFQEVLFVSFSDVPGMSKH